MSNAQTGRTGQVYVKKQGAQGTPAVFSATDAMRTRNLTFTFDPKNKANTEEKRSSPGRSIASRVDMRETAGWQLEALLRPSGTLNTLPEGDDVLECAFGAKDNVTLATTVASGGSVSGATLTSAAGLTQYSAVLITCPDGKKRVRQLSAEPAGAVVTWAPDLPVGQQPANGAAVKGCLVYKPTTALIFALTIGHYLSKADGSAGLSRQVYDAGVDALSLNFDSSTLPLLKASGFAKTMMDAQAKPGAFTTVGTIVPTGLTGEAVIGAAFDVKWLKMSIDIKNGLWSRNESYGYGSQEEFLRTGYRDIAVGLDMRAGAASDKPYDAALAGSNVGVFKQSGFTEGSIIAVRMPNVEFKVPDTDDPDDIVNWPFKGMALESADGANDDLFVILA